MVLIFCMFVLTYMEVVKSENGPLCPQDFCGGERPFCHQLQCFPSCPQKTYNDNFTCVETCSVEQLTIGRNCTTNCTDDKPYIEDKECVSVCSEELYLNVENNTCIHHCEIDSVLFNWTCVKECPVEFPYKMPKRWIYYGLYLHSVINDFECVRSCPETTIIGSNECLLSCPKHFVSFNQSCVQRCPDSHNLLMEISSEYNKMAVCVESCPSNFVLDDRTCTKRCPNDKFVANNSCVMHCSDDELVCSSKFCSTSELDYGTRSCVLQCPSGHYSFNNECFRHCRSTANKFSLRGVCVKECPNNLSIAESNRCVDECPEGYYIHKSTCTRVCPYNTALFNGTCHYICPESSPYKYTYPTGQSSCLNECPQGYYVYKDSCSASCPYNTALVNGTCYASCPDPVPYKYTYTTGIYYWQKETHVECVSTCPNNRFYLDKICVSKCLGHMYIFRENSTCLDYCPDTHPYTLITFKKSETIYECVDQQPTGSYERNNTFFTSCPADSRYVSGNSCLTSCPNEDDYKYYLNDAIHCFDKCPLKTFTLNNTCLSKCPRGFRNVNGHCQQGDKCPSDFPNVYDQLINGYSQDDIIPHCVAACPEGTVKANMSCQMWCPDTQFILNNECVEECPLQHFKYFGNRKTVTIIEDLFIDKEALFCTGICAEVNVLEPCVVSRIKEKFLIVSRCASNTIDRSKPYYYETNNCTILNVYNLNGTLMEKCPAFTFGRDCVSQCPTISPLKLRDGAKGTFCVKICPANFYVDVDNNHCVRSCGNKRVFGNTCVSKCPDSHPFWYKRSYSSVAVCYDECPDSRVGNTSTYECMYSFECDSFKYDKKCYLRCPDGTYPSQIGTQKYCNSLQPQIVGVIICVVLIFLCLVLNVGVCTERKTLTGLKPKIKDLRKKLCKKKRTPNVYTENPAYDIEDVDHELEETTQV